MDKSLEEGGRDKNKEMSTMDFRLLGAMKQCPTKGLNKGSLVGHCRIYMK